MNTFWKCLEMMYAISLVGHFTMASLLPWLESDSCSINISTAFYTAQFMIISVSIIGFALAIKNCGLMYYDVLQDSFLLTIT
jgi:hypothetical protein